MLRILAGVVIAVSLVSAAPQAAKKPEKKNVPAETMTGCLDQQGETYVLRGLDEARTVATLRGKAFSDDNFARYVGHKVTVHGNVTKDGDNTVVHVTKVDDGGPGCSVPK